MGYTIYWKWRGGQMSDAWFKNIQEKVELAYRDALDTVRNDESVSLLDVLEGSGVWVDWREECFHEGFSGSMLRPSDFEFCKTARKYYDKAVKLALIEAQRLSDNAWDISCGEDGVYKKNTVLRESVDGTWLPSELVKNPKIVTDGISPLKSGGGVRLTKQQALCLLALGFDDREHSIMCKENGDDDDWVGMTAEDIDTLQGDEYQTFEIW